MKKEVCFCIHGHFYQPPRENAWTQEIEIQESAAPYHNWNERIYHECYSPNTKARVLDEKGKAIGTVNNFEKMSFNVGPTLLSWLEIKHPETYQAILGADQKSSFERNGHGNAIAQVYNHMIMPLASRRDKITQVKWGLAEFRYRFKREPEGMWLPETACDEETIEILAIEGIKFTILAPKQAARIRKFIPGDHQESGWNDVSSGTINTKVPYRYFISSDRKKSVDLFFYDGSIAHDVAFGNLAFEAKLFANRLEAAKSDGKTGLIHVAADGETFGHHKAYGEKALAYLLNVEAPKRALQVVNYGEFLESHPPNSEVILAEGEDGQGTSWSCAHGVKRWKEHCGCRGSGPADWTQEWRKPLREALDWLRDELIDIFESQGSRYLKDIWKARNDYIEIILDRSEKRRWLFFERHASRQLTEAEVNATLALLEMQRYAMLMYTSCGWFFTEISGIETVQILQYAARAIQLAGEISQKNFEGEFLKRLFRAKSNVRGFKNGRGVYEKLVKPAIMRDVSIIPQF